MSRKKHKKNQLIGSELRLPESYDNLSAKDYIRKTVTKLSGVLKPLYSTMFEGDETLEASVRPLDFVEAQMLKITKFLTINADYYLNLTNLDDYEEYFEQIRQTIDVAHCDIQVGLAFDEDYVTDEVDMALTMVAAFFDELDKLFIPKTHYIVCHTDELVDNISVYEIAEDADE